MSPQENDNINLDIPSSITFSFYSTALNKSNTINKELICTFGPKQMSSVKRVCSSRWHTPQSRWQAPQGGTLLSKGHSLLSKGQSLLSKGQSLLSKDHSLLDQGPSLLRVNVPVSSSSWRSIRSIKKATVK